MSKLRFLIAALLFAAGPALAAPDGTVSVTTGAAATIGSSIGRYSLLIKNTDTANTVYCGTVGGSASTWMPLVAGQSESFQACYQNLCEAADVIKCIAVGGTIDVRYREKRTVE